jgi:hypothetical protein
MRQAIRQQILLLAEQRGEKTFCPSEVARALAEEWRPLMSAVRSVAADLLEEGAIQCTQRGEPCHPLTAQGAIRLSAQQA